MLRGKFSRAGKWKVQEWLSMAMWHYKGRTVHAEIDHRGCKDEHSECVFIHGPLHSFAFRQFATIKLDIWTWRSSSKTFKPKDSKQGAENFSPVRNRQVGQTQEWSGWAPGMGVNGDRHSDSSWQRDRGAEAVAASIAHWSKGQSNVKKECELECCQVFPTFQRKLAIWHFRYFIWNLIF